MAVSVTWFGHSNFRVVAGDATVLVDPFFTGNPTCPSRAEDVSAADMVLVTHDHGDHTGDAVSLCNRLNAMCACVVGTGERLMAAGLRQSLLPAGMGFNIGGTFVHKGISVTMTQAFHSSDSGVPTGFVVCMPDGFTFYHAGDTGLFGDMALIGSLYAPQVAMLPCGDFFTMDGKQAAEAARLLNAPRVIPMHWGTFPLLAQDTSDFRAHMARVAPSCGLVDMKPGDTVTF